MTSDDDATTDLDELDDAELPLLSAADETYVRDLLGALPPVEVPDDLAARLDTALRAAAQDPVEEPATAGTSVGTTVVALDDVRARSRGRRTRVLQVAAAGLLVVAGVLGVVKLAGSGRVAQTSTAAGAGAAASAPAVEKTLLTRSGHAYSDVTLVSDVRSLAAHRSLSPGTTFGADTGATTTPQTTDGTGQVVGTPSAAGGGTGGSLAPGSRSGLPQPAPSGTLDDPAVATQSGLVACLAAVEEGLAEPVTPLAVDQGTYRGQAALVVVLPGSLAPSTSYDVFVVGVSCGENGDAHLLTYQLVEVT